MNPAYSASRRHFLRNTACGLGQVALASMLGQTAAASSALDNPLAARDPMIKPTAKRVIFLWMMGGPSAVDTFDYKPELQKRSGDKVKFWNSRYREFRDEKVYGSPWNFHHYGQTGHRVSDLFPHMGQVVDDLCFVQSMHTEGVAHGPASLFMHTGSTNLIRPSMGAWVSYGLGTENDNLPSFMTISAPATKGGPRLYGPAFLPAHHQGTMIGRADMPAKDARIPHLQNPDFSMMEQRHKLDFLQEINQSQYARLGKHESDLDAVIGSYELAFKMQRHAPELLDLTEESEATRKLYGIDEKETDDYGRQCLMARRMAEAGVRFIQVNYSDNKATPMWDQHSKLHLHEQHAKATDKPVAALIKDLKARGLLEDTLVIWGGEFGRTPYSQNGDGRDHNPRGFTMFMAGGGVKAGYVHGATDEFGFQAVQDKVHMHDLHATMLHALGLDHEKLTFRYAGRDFRLTDVHGRVVKELFA